MTMRVLIIDNRGTDLNVKNMERWIKKQKGCSCEIHTEVEFEPEVILSNRPDLVVVDVALKAEEEEYFEQIVSGAAKYHPRREVSGIEYCRKLKVSFADLPVILASQFFHPQILSSALEAGADGFLFKRQMQKETFLPAIRAAFCRSKTDDMVLYERLRELLEDTSSGAWERKHLLKAMDSFFTRGSGSRRLTGLWCSLAELVEQLIPSDVMNELLRALMDTEGLLLAANPGIRDHVRHSGNVFWLGYYLLNKVKTLRDPTKLSGYCHSAFEGSGLSPFDQLNLAWILASLLHDVGYLRERIDKVEARVTRGRALFGISGEAPQGAITLCPPRALDALLPRMQKMGPEAQRLYSMIAKIQNSWGNVIENKKVEDHGLASASTLWGCLSKTPGDHLNRPELLHAVAAIALHNLPKWNKQWPDSAGIVRLPIGLLPCAWLLAYSDELQGWGREPEKDPFDVETVEGVAEARKKHREAYVRSSRISSFEIRSVPKCSLGVGVEIGIQYMMVHGENAEAVAEGVREGVQKWRRESAPRVRDTLGLDSLIHTTVTHWIPAPVADPIVVTLDERAV